MDVSQAMIWQKASLRRQDRCKEASLYAALQLYKARAQGWQGIFTPLLTSAKPFRCVKKKNAWQSSSDYIEASALEQEIGLTELDAYSASKQQVNYSSLWPAT